MSIRPFRVVLDVQNAALKQVLDFRFRREGVLPVNTDPDAVVFEGIWKGRDSAARALALRTIRPGMRPMLLGIGGTSDRVFDEAFPLPLEIPFFMVRLLAGLRALGLKEPRRFERVGCAKRVFVEESPGRYAPVSLRNFSEGGMFLACAPSSKLASRGRILRFVLHPGNRLHPPFKGVGVVRWIRHETNEQGPPGVGVEFSSFFGLGPRAPREFMDLYLRRSQDGLVNLP